MATEKRLIDANALRAQFSGTGNFAHDLWHYTGVWAHIDNAPTVDAMEVVHGRWINVRDGWGICSNCHRVDEIHKLATHCRFCGAKMDGGMTNETD